MYFLFAYAVLYLPLMTEWVPDWQWLPLYMTMTIQIFSNCDVVAVSHFLNVLNDISHFFLNVLNDICMIASPLLSLQSCLESPQVHHKIPDFIFEIINQNKKGELQWKVFVSADRHQVYDGAKATLELGSGKVGLIFFYYSESFWW